MSDLDEIALNAIRYRAATEDKPSMASDDRRWLLQYIDRRERFIERLERANLVESEHETAPRD